MAASTITIWAVSSLAEAGQRLHADDQADAGHPDDDADSFRDVTASWRVMASVRKNVNIGAVELRMVATPASSVRDPQATIVHGMTLLRQAWNRSRRQVVASMGIRTPRQRMMATTAIRRSACGKRSR